MHMLDPPPISRKPKSGGKIQKEKRADRKPSIWEKGIEIKCARIG